MGTATATAAPTWDVGKACAHLRTKAEPKPTRWCARYTANAVEVGFGTLRKRARPGSAKDFGPWLAAYGFEAVQQVAAGSDVAGLSFDPGDVAVIEAFSAPDPKDRKKQKAHPHGHLQMFDGTAWISDFVQHRGPRGFWAGPGYEQAKPGFVVYRYKPPEPAGEEKADEKPAAAGGGSGYLTEAATLQCVCGGPVVVAGKGVQAWKINGSPVLTEEGLKQATVMCPKPPTGLGCTAVQSVVTGKAGKAKAGGQTPLLAGAMAITNCGGLVQVVGAKPGAAKTGGAGDDGPPEKPPEKVHKPDKKKSGELKFRLKDRRGRAAAGEWFRVTLPDGSEAHGLLDATGAGAVTGLDPGATCRLAFPNLKYARWFAAGRPDTAAVAVTAAEGDTLSGIATQNEMPGWKALWDYPGNATLRQDRCAPDAVAAGGRVCVPRPDRALAVGKQEHDLLLDQCHPARTATFRFVDATTGRPLPDLTVAILQPDFQTREETTNPDGEVVIDGRSGEVFAVTRVVRPGFLGLGDPGSWGGRLRRSLDDLLRDTLIGASDPATRVGYVDRASGPPKFPPPAARQGAGTADIHDLPLWDVVVPPDALDKVTRLTCVVPGSCHGHPAVVCESVEWDPFKVRAGGDEFTLPLTPPFLTRIQALEGGRLAPWRPELILPPPHPGGGLVWPRLPGGRTHAAPPPVRWPGNRLWPLEGRIDIGFQNVFAYQIDADAAGKPVLTPVPDDVCRHDRFLPPAAGGPVTAAVGGKPVDVPVVRFRAAVVTSLVCNKARNDYEPGGVMDAARLYPTAMFVANMPAEWAAGGVRVARPAAQPPHHPGMRPYIRAGLYADNNTMSIPDPTWSNLFAYYDVTNPTGTYTVAHRRTGTAVPLRWGSAQAVRRPPVAGAVTEILAERLEKVPGQGSYDNVHLAPPMFVDPPPIAPVPPPDQAKVAATFADISMAPFCVHDCFHTHWRWTPKGANQQQSGWSLADEPYSTPGAPMVAANQQVELTVAGAGFHYAAHIAAPEPGRWQVVYHHGSGYSVGEADVLLSAGKLRTGLIFLLRQTGSHAGGVVGGGVWVPPDSSDWPLFYWHLRYAVRLATYAGLGQLLHPTSFGENNVVASDPALLAAAVGG